MNDVGLLETFQRTITSIPPEEGSREDPGALLPNVMQAMVS